MRQILFFFFFFNEKRANPISHLPLQHPLFRNLRLNPAQFIHLPVTFLFIPILSLGSLLWRERHQFRSGVKALPGFWPLFCVCEGVCRSPLWLHNRWQSICLSELLVHLGHFNTALSLGQNVSTFADCLHPLWLVWRCSSNSRQCTDYKLCWRRTIGSGSRHMALLSIYFNSIRPTSRR